VQEALIATFDAEAATPANWLPGDKTIDTPLDRMLEQPAGWLKRILKAQAS
jgi:alkyl hydroperoxide reductase subunit AhpC